MLYVVNADACYSAPHGLARLRNVLFSAITRSKAWVRVCGVGEPMEELAKEHASLKDDDYKLRFRYPTKEELTMMKSLHQDNRGDETTLIDPSQDQSAAIDGRYREQASVCRGHRGTQAGVVAAVDR